MTRPEQYIDHQLLSGDASTPHHAAEIPSPPAISWRAILAAGFDLDPSATMRWAGHDAIDMQVGYERIGRALVALRRARKQIAKVAKLDSSRLRIATKIVGMRLFVAVLGSSEDEAALSNPEVVALADDLAKRWHSAIARRLAISIDPMAPSDGAAGQSEPATAALDLMSSVMAKAITQGGQYTGSLRISIGTHAPREVLSPLAVESLIQPCRAGTYTLSDTRSVRAHILRNGGTNTVILRATGAPKQWSATYRARGHLASLLPLLIGYPPVMLEIREHMPDDTDSPPRHDCIVDAIVGTTDEWTAGHIAALSVIVGEMAQLHALGPGGHKIT